MSPRQQVVGLIVALAVVFAAAGLGSLFTSRSVGTWYQEIAKPDWTPPSWLFGPVWTALYLAMAVAVWLVWRAAGFAGAPIALALFAAQLALNAAWSGLFFALREPGYALIDIAALWLAIAATIAAFAPHSLVAAGLLVPYLGWVSYAAALNASIWRLN